MLEAELPDHVMLRALRREDAAALLAAYDRNRENLAPFEPSRSDAFYTPVGMASHIDLLSARLAGGLTVPLLLLRDGAVVGRVTLDGVVRGASSSAALG